MIYGLVLVIHVLVALFLIAVILLQGGRGGLGETLGGAAAQSLFGGGANTVMTKVTAGCASLFMITCLSLAMLSTSKGQSVLERVPMSADQLPLALPQAPRRSPAPSPSTSSPPRSKTGSETTKPTSSAPSPSASPNASESTPVSSKTTP